MLGRPHRSLPPQPQPALVVPGLCRRLLTRPAAFGLGGGNNKNKPSNSDAMASAVGTAWRGATRRGAYFCSASATETGAAMARPTRARRKLPATTGRR